MAIRARTAAAALLAALAAGRAPAQEAAVSPPLAPDHWAVLAAGRAEALGLAPGYFPAQRTVPRAAVAGALREAAERAAAVSPAHAALTAGWLARFEEEFAEHRPDAPASSALRVLGGHASAGSFDLRGRLEPAAGIFHLRTDPTPVPDERGIALGVGGGVAVGRHLSLFAEPRATRSEVAVPRWEAGVGTGRVALSAGRQPLGYGSARGGGVVLGAGPPLFRVQVETTRPVRLPGVLRGAGDVAFHTFGTRLAEARHPGDPWLWGARLAVRPHPRVSVAVNRASIFGGDSMATPTNLRNVGGMLLGLISEEFENQVVSMDFRWRLPTDRLLPLTAYLEWGADDAAGSWWRVPGIVAGAYTPTVPGLPQVAAGVEYATFAVFCCDNPPWYFNASHTGGWVAGGAPLGHPLAGDGWEAQAYAHGELAGGRLRLDVRGFLRHREEEGYHLPPRAGNLLGPDRFGGSRGGVLRAVLRATPRVDLGAAAAAETGRGWSERQIEASATLLF